MVWLDLGRVCAAVLVLLVGPPVLAHVDKALQGAGWSEVTFDDKMPNRFTADASGGILVQSERSVSLMQRALDVDLPATPLLSWRWRVAAQVPPTDLAVKGEDDRSLALYVAFPFVPEEASAFERMSRAIVEKLAGRDAPGRVLMYVWGGKGERGDRIDSPYLGSSGVITILRPANSEADIWFDETVDVAEDYRRTFGTEPPDPISIAIGADSDDTETMALGVVADLDFIAPPDDS